jgi:TonB-linked SusC/RagA family outer membrane protein
MKYLLQKHDLLYRIMRIGIQQIGILLLAVSISHATVLSGQNILERQISIKAEKMPLKSVLSQIERVANVRFMYSSKVVGAERKVDVLLSQQPLGAVLQSVFEPLGLGYRISGEHIILSRTKTLENFSSNPMPSTSQIKGVAEKSLVGTVTEPGGDPLPGVSVLLKGTHKGTVTDPAGRFVLPLSDSEFGANPILVFSFVGFISTEIAVNNRTQIDIELEVDNKSLEELVVVGYGTQKKVNLTGAVDAIKAEDLISRPVGQASSALQGVAPGVSVVQRSGKPGADGGTIRIRGVGTLADSNPLVLVDGVPMSMNNVDMNEIESISILKDAASSAIYGSRAANGVILITTKRGKSGQLAVSYRNSLGWQQPTALAKKVSGYDHMIMINQAFRNVGRNPTFTDEYVAAYQTNAPSDAYPETNWHQEMLSKRAFQQNHYVSVHGGTEKMSVLGSVAYMNQDGLMKSNFKRLNIRLNTDIKVKENLQIGVDIVARNDIRAEPPQQWGWLARYPHNIPGKNEDGSWGIGWDGQNGWATLDAGGKTEDKRHELLANIKLNWQPVKGMNVSLQAAPNIHYRQDKSFRKHVNLYFPDGTIVNPSPYRANLADKFTKTVTDNYRAIVEYKKSLSGHSFGVLGGVEAISFRDEWLRGYRDQYPLENYDVLNVGSVANQQATGSAEEWSLLSYFGRLNYSFNDRYLLEANIRADGSSRFTGNNKFGYFPSVSAGWRVSEEAFLKDVRIINELKLRASWGSLGNQNISNNYYPFASTITMGQNYVFGDNIPALGAALLNSGNANITWETTRMVNIGIDASIGDFDLSADYYIKNTSDILLRLPSPRVSGLIEPFQNAGKVQNKGWDLGIGYRKRFGDLNLNIAGNLSDVKNRIVTLVGTGPYIDGRTIQQEGAPHNSIFGLRSLGYFQNETETAGHATQFGSVQPGDIKYEDINNDGQINAEDRTIIGSVIPNYSYGLNITASYKGFDLGFFGQGIGKVDGYLDNFATMAFYLGGTAQEWHKDYWTPENPNAAYPRLTFNYPNNEQVSSQWVKSAAYFRLKNLQVGYTLPSALTQKVKVNRCRLFTSGQNLFTIHKFYDSFDPESPVGEGTHYPQVKVFVFGVEVSF